jgi:PDZ domain
MNLQLVLCIGLASHFLANAVWAQPALDRVEKSLRKQGVVRAGDPPADDVQTAGNSPGYLGVIADDRQEKGKGVRVMESVPNGPAAKGGLKVGDLIIAIDGQAIENVEEMTASLQGRPAGAVIKFRVDRKGETRDLEVKLERRPSPDARRLPQFGKQPEEMPQPGPAADNGPGPGDAPTSESVILNTRRPKLGVRTVSLTQFIREQTRLPGSYVAGVYVTYVDRDAPAGRAGLPVAAVITTVDGEPIDSPDTLAELVHRAGPGQTLNVTYYFRDHESVTQITLAGGSGAAQPPAPGPQMTVRARPAAPDQPPGFAPDLSPDDSGASLGATIEALQQRIAELEKRVADLEAAAAKSAGADAELSLDPDN